MLTGLISYLVLSYIVVFGAMFIKGITDPKLIIGNLFFAPLVFPFLFMAAIITTIGETITNMFD